MSSFLCSLSASCVYLSASDHITLPPSAYTPSPTTKQCSLSSILSTPLCILPPYLTMSNSMFSPSFHAVVRLFRQTKMRHVFYCFLRFRFTGILLNFEAMASRGRGEGGGGMYWLWLFQPSILEMIIEGFARRYNNTGSRLCCYMAKRPGTSQH